MAVKAILFFCASALLVQAISGQCLGRANEVIEVANIGYGAGYGLAGNGLAAGYGNGCGVAGNGFASGNGLPAAELAIGNNGGALSISSSSPIAPTGLSVTSENVIEGPIAVFGELPFLAAVAFDGQVPSAGTAGVAYGSGNSNVGIVSERLAGAELATGLGYGASVAGAELASGLGYGAGLAGGHGYGAGIDGGLGYGAEIAGGLGYGAGLAGGRGYGSAGLAGGLVGRGGCGSALY